MKENPRVSVYLRVSTDDQSTGMQKLEIEEYLKIRGWTQVTFYEDHGLTGTNTNRPQFKLLLNAVQKRKTDVVIIWSLSRLFRSLKDMINNLEIFTECGVSLVSLKENLDMTSATGRLLTHIIGAFAEFEAEATREKVIAGLRNARSKGIILGRPKVRNDENIHKLRSEGLSVRKIAARIGCSSSTVQKSISKGA